MVLDTTMRIKITSDGVDVQTREEVLPSGDLNLRCGTEQLLRFDNAGMGSDEEGTYECGAWHIDDIPFAERTALHVEAALQWREQQITNTYGKRVEKCYGHKNIGGWSGSLHVQRGLHLQGQRD
jgi:hypothetical protein